MLFITFPSTLYLQDASLFYKVNDGTEWTSVEMTGSGEGSYSASIPAQPAGTVVAYYVGLRDIFGQTSAVNPIAADRLDPGLPNYILVGYGLVATENADDLSQLGSWTEGQPEDNAATGEWEFGPPIGSYNTPGDPTTVCQPGAQHTDGGSLCWYTGNALSTSSPLGDNDVDEGSTTLMGPNIDLTSYSEPARSYWRWYTNNPPSGANPYTDWWQVYASPDNGDTWFPVEDTKSGERNWRRKVFPVKDVLGEDATQIRLKFIASDSIRPEQDLEGGSLVEAALDDIELWSAAAPDFISEQAQERVLGVWPSPTTGQLNVEVRIGHEPGMSIEVLDLTGRMVLAPRAFPCFQQKAIGKHNPETLTMHEMAGGFLALTLIMPFYLKIFPAAYYLPTAYDWLWLLLLAWACTVYCFDLQLNSLKKLSPFTCNLAYNLEPVYGIILAFIFFSENKGFNSQFYLGVGLNILAVALQTIRVWLSRSRAFSHMGALKPE